MKRNKKLYILVGILLVLSVLTLAVTHMKKKTEDIRNSGENVMELSADSVTKLSWKLKEDGRSFAFHKDGHWIYDQDEAFPVDDEKIQKVLGQFEEFAAEFIIDHVEDFGQYGLDDPECVISIEAGEDQYEIKVGDYSKMDSQRYVSTGDGNVYLMKHDPMDDFDAELSNFIKNDEIPEFGHVTRIHFTGEEDHEILQEENKGLSHREDDKYFEHSGDRVYAMDTELVENYLHMLTNLNLTDYATYHVSEEELTDYGLEEPELVVMIKYNETDDDGNETEKTSVISINKDPAASEEDEVTQAYLRVDESPVIYRITGDEYTGLMEKSGSGLRHKEILPAEFEKISRIDISLEGENYGVTVKEKDGSPVFSYEDQELDTTNFKDALTGLRVKEFTSEEPSGKKEISLTVTVDEKDQPQVLIDIYRYSGEECLVTIDNQPMALTERSKVVDLIEAVHGFTLQPAG